MTLGERIKKARKILELTQQKFASQIGSTQNNIASYEIGRREPSAAALDNICKTFKINEEWLRNGDGEMFVQCTRDEELKRSVDNLLRGNHAKFKQRLISVLLSLDESDWMVLEKRLKEIVGMRDIKEEVKISHNEQASTTHQPTESDEERKQREWIEKVERERAEAHRLLDEEIDAKAKMEEMKRLSAYGYGDKNDMAG